MNNPRLRLMAGAAFASCFCAAMASAQTTFTQPLVTSVAPAANVMGSATVPPDDLAAFSSAVPGSLGGVFDFTPTLSTGTTVVSGTAGTSPTRNVRLTFTRALQNFTNNTSYTTSSGTRGITTQSTPGNYGFTIGEVLDTATTPAPISGLHVTRVGFVVLSRVNLAGETVYPLDLRVTATLSNGITRTAIGSLSDTKGQNVFFGFTADPHTAITRIGLEAFVPGTTTPVSARLLMDDIVTIVEDIGALTPGPSLSQITAEDTYLAPGGTFDFGASSTSPINAENVTITINGVDAADKFVLGGTPTARIISISGLDADSYYQAVVKVSNASGVATRNFHFTTLEPLPTFTDITPDGSYLTASGVFRFQVKSTTTTLSSSNIAVVLNGADAASQLTFQGTASDKTVTISGLTPNTIHRADVTVTAGPARTATRRYHFHTLGEPLAFSNTHGFSDDSIYPIGPITPFIDSLSRWEPHAATTNVAEIIDSGEPSHGKIFRRTQGGGTRADFLYFPPLADGMLKVSFDARVSDATHRTLDICTQPDSTNTTLMGGFIQFGRVSGKLTYFDNVSYNVIEGFTLDTNWHHYELVHHYTGPKARTYDLHADGNLIANIPWRNQMPLTLARLRFQTIARDVPLDETGLHSTADIDNVTVTALPLRPAPIAAPVTVTELGQGVVYRKYTHTNLFSSKQNVYVTDINLDDPAVAVKFPYSGATKRTVPTHASNVPGAVAAVNGQFFNTAGSIQHLKVGGTLVNPTNAAHDQEAITDDGLGTRYSVRLVPKPALDWGSLPDATVVASGPHIFQDGNKAALDPGDSIFGRNPRTIAAWTYDNHLLLVVIDGRTSASAGMSFPELQEYVDHLGWIKNATNFDGGGSSTMWTNGSVVNVPSDGSLRQVTNAIAVTAAPVAIPAAPVGVIAVEGEGQFTLHWQHSSGATSYEVRRSTTAGGPYTVIGNPVDPYFTDTTAVSGTDYFYVIIAKNSAGVSLGSTPLSTGTSGAWVVPSVAITTSGGNVQLTFDSIAGRKYQLERSTTLKVGEWEDVGPSRNGTGAAISIPQTLSPTNTFYRIRIE